MIHIRKATMKDLPILLEFEQGVIEAERPMDETIKKGKTYYYDLPEMIQNPDFELIVAEINDEVVGSGYATLKKGRECFDYEYFSYLGFMYTKPEHRGKGVNKKVMDYLYGWSKSKGIKEVRLTVYPDNPSAIKAYEKAGMHSCLLTMRIDLNQ